MADIEKYTDEILDRISVKVIDREDLLLDLDDLKKEIGWAIERAEEDGYDEGRDDNGDMYEDEREERRDEEIYNLSLDVHDFFVLMQPFLDEHFDATNPAHNDAWSYWKSLRKEIVNGK